MNAKNVGHVFGMKKESANITNLKDQSSLYVVVVEK